MESKLNFVKPSDTFKPTMEFSKPTLGLLDPSKIRSWFSQEISLLYQAEVPLYSSLLSVVADINARELDVDPALKSQLQATGELGRLSLERHGAIRLGTSSELATMGRLFRIMGMHPVGYYDLSTAGVPVHSTCFRPYHTAELSKNPFRMFTSLLRMDLLPPPLRILSERVLSRRQIFSARMLELIAVSEKQGGLLESQGGEFVAEAMKTFAWHPGAVVTVEEYHLLQLESPLLADVAAFPGPHINHLTPRTLNIDEVQSSMGRLGIPPKDAIEGPPRRKCPILLRQTSFKALEEPVKFPAEAISAHGSSLIRIDEAVSLSDIDYVDGAHRARFGEVEQRGAALTPKGLQLYDSLLDKARRVGLDCRNSKYEDIFSGFPDAWEEIYDQNLAWFYYSVVKPTVADVGQYAGMVRPELERALVQDGFISYEPLVYEDFLPVSAAGIFQSNLGVSGVEKERREGQTGDRPGFERAIGDLKIKDQMSLYEACQRESMDKCLAYLNLLG